MVARPYRGLPCQFRMMKEKSLCSTLFKCCAQHFRRIEHRMFCHIAQNWRGKPLVSYEVIVNLIAATTTRKGLAIRSDIDENDYTTAIKVTDDQMSGLSIRRTGFHGEWNYTFTPRH